MPQRTLSSWSRTTLASAAPAIRRPRACQRGGRAAPLTTRVELARPASTPRAAMTLTARNAPVRCWLIGCAPRLQGSTKPGLCAPQAAHLTMARRSSTAKPALTWAFTFNTRIASLVKHHSVAHQSLFRRLFLTSLCRSVHVAAKPTCFVMG